MALSSQNSNGSLILNLSASSINLCTALVNWSNATDGIVAVIGELGEWLGREKLGRLELQDCLQRARQVATPNHLTNAFFMDIMSHPQATSVMPMFTQLSGSLGRIMASDSDLCWMVSTVACLFQYHKEYDVVGSITVLLRSLHKELTESDEKLDSAHPLYDPATAHFSRVVTKIVGSIWYNVVNSGHTTMHLPEELMSICRAGHNLGAYRLGSVINKLRQSRPRVMIRTKHLLRNLTHWLLLHFDGQFQVVVGGKIVYEKMLGGSGREIELRVAAFCREAIACEDEADMIEVIEDVGDSPQVLFSGKYPSRSEFPETPIIRRQLYQIPTSDNSESRITLPSVLTYTKCVAQVIMKWLLELPIKPPNHFSNLGFAVFIQEDSSPKSYKIVHILSRSPGILNMMWGEVKCSSIIYSRPAGVEKRSFDRSEEHANVPDRTFDELIPWFPILGDLLKEVEQNCRCLRCKEPELVPGCLKHSALVHCLNLLGHGIADGFGVTDASGTRDTLPVANGMLQVLLDLVEEDGVLWDNWFGVAATVLLGCQCPGVPVRLIANDQSLTTLAAVQYGSLAAMAPWVDLTQNLHVLGCFSLIRAEGKLGVSRPTASDQGIFKGIGEDYAVVKTEMTERTSRSSGPLDPATTGSIRRKDNIAVSDSFLVQTRDDCYTFLSRVRSHSHSRIIDPTDTLLRLTRGFKSISCDHEKDQNRMLKSDSSISWDWYTFDDILGGWSKYNHYFRFQSDCPVSSSSSEDGGRDPKIHISKVMDTFLKRNVALALAMNGTLCINEDSSCLPCMANSKKAASAQEGPCNDLYIINVDPQL